MTQPAASGPTAPIALDGPPSRYRIRFSHGVVAVDSAVRQRLAGACAEVSDDPDACTEAARDWWPLSTTWAVKGEVPARPPVIARPRAADEVSAVLAICHEARLPVTPAAGRSGVCGASIPVFGGVVLDLTALDGVDDVEDRSLLLTVRPGTFGDRLEAWLRAEAGVTLGHWPQSMALSTVGGWLACRSAGQYSTRYGKIEDMVAGLEVVLADGSRLRAGGRFPRAAVGPDLSQLFVGSEGTLGVITSATLRVHPLPPQERRAAYAFADFAAGLEVCRLVLRRGATPAVLRLYDERESRRYAEGANVLLVLDEGDPAIVEATMTIVDAECVAAGADRLDAALVERWLEHRNDVSALEEAIRQDLVVDTTEIAGAWGVLPAIYRAGVDALKAVDGIWVASAHQSHAYSDGACLYFTWAGQPTDGDKERLYRDAWDTITRVTLDHGGAISHHHGVGLNRSRFVADALGSAMGPLVAIKRTLDPHGILNPGKLGLPSPFGEPPWP